RLTLAGPMGHLFKAGVAAVASVTSEPLRLSVWASGSIVPVKLELAATVMVTGITMLWLKVVNVMPDFGIEILPVASTVPLKDPVNGPTSTGVPEMMTVNLAAVAVTVMFPTGATTAPAMVAKAAITNAPAVIR